MHLLIIYYYAEIIIKIIKNAILAFIINLIKSVALKVTLLILCWLTLSEVDICVRTVEVELSLTIVHFYGFVTDSN